MEGLKRYLLMMVCSAGSYIPLNAQNIQLGFGSGLNTNYFRSSYSDFDGSSFKSLPAPGVNIFVPVYLNLNQHFALKTGIGYQLKRYTLVQTQFEIPGVSGTIRYGSGFGVGEFPILASFKPGTSGKLKIEMLGGCVMSVNSWQSTFISSEIHESIEPANVTVRSGNELRNNTYSADLYVGISLCSFKDRHLSQQLIFAYQYGLTPISRSVFTTEISTATASEKHNIILKPVLSGFTLTYSFFPGRLRFDTPQ